MEEKLKLHNYMEMIVEREAENLMKMQNMCTCEQCKLDVVALALNNLKPHYVVSERGSLFAKLDSFEAQNTVDVLAEVAAAAQKVNARPRHQSHG